MRINIPLRAQRMPSAYSRQQLRLQHQAQRRLNGNEALTSNARSALLPSTVSRHKSGSSGRHRQTERLAKKAHVAEGLEPVVGLTEFHFRCLEKHVAECDEGLMEVLTAARTAKIEEPANDAVCALCNVLQAARMLTAVAFEMSGRLHATARTDCGCAHGSSDACSGLSRPVRHVPPPMRGVEPDAINSTATMQTDVSAWGGMEGDVVLSLHGETT